MVLAEMTFPALFILAIVGFVVAMLIWSAKHQKQVRANWETFARKHGLSHPGGAWTSVQGWFGRVHIQLNKITRGTGKNRSTFTQFHANANAPMPEGLVLTKEGFFSKVGKMFGGQDVQIGDREIDEGFIIKANDLKGTHQLLSNPHVKKALLYCMARHPGMRVQGNHILVELSGTVSSLPRIEGVFQDLAYLAETFDAACQEIAQRGSPQPARPPSKAAAAEILGDGIRSSGPQVRSPDASDMQTALHQMNDALHQYANKVESGQQYRTEQTSLQGSEESTNVNWQSSFNVDPGEAFDEPHVGDAFDDPHLLEDDDARPAADYESEAERAMREYDPRKALADRPSSLEEADLSSMNFDDPEAEKAFENPDLLNQAEERAPPDERPADADPTPATLGSLDELVGGLSQSGQMSSERDKLISAHRGRSWEVEIDVDRVSGSFGFDLPDGLRDGKTVEGRLPNGTGVAVLLPKERAGEVASLKRGEKLKVWGKVAGWDDLFKKLTLHTE